MINHEHSGIGISILWYGAILLVLNFTHDPSKHKFFTTELPLTSVNAS